MAILRELKPCDYQAGKLTDTYGRYSVSNYKGEKLFHVLTYGSKDRECKGKVSQQIDLNENMARELCSLLKMTFSLG